MENEVGCSVERGHLVSDIIQNIAMDSQYYTKRMLTYKLKKGSPLENLIATNPLDVPRKKKKAKEVKVDVPVVPLTSASYQKKIKTVLNAEGGGLSTSDLEKNIRAAYPDDDFNKTVFGNMLNVMVREDELIKDGEMYSLPGSCGTTNTNQ